MTELALDSSAVVAWILQEVPRWKQIDQFVQDPRIDLILPGPALTEACVVAARKGNTSGSQAIQKALLAAGMRVEPAQEPDHLRAADLLLGSIAAPMRRPNGEEATLSLGDGLILAVTERLGVPICTGDLA